jgi:hypothetical protein
MLYSHFLLGLSDMNSIGFGDGFEKFYNLNLTMSNSLSYQLDITLRWSQ